MYYDGIIHIITLVLHLHAHALSVIKIMGMIKGKIRKIKFFFIFALLGSI
jgi:hypothetical protein